jgi:hypothetical protein
MMFTGSVEKSRLRRFLTSPGRIRILRAEALRRASAQAGRHVSVLTYSAYAPRVKMATAWLDGPFGKTPGMLF